MPVNMCRANEVYYIHHVVECVQLSVTFVYNVFNHLSQQTTKYDMDMRKCISQLYSIRDCVYLNQMNMLKKNILKSQNK